MHTQEQHSSAPHPQGHSASQPVVVVHQQTQATASPMVLVNNVLDSRQSFFLRHPYYRRGAQFSNGCQCGGPQIMTLMVLGGMLIIFGFLNFILGIYYGIFMLVIGGILMFLGVSFLRKAKAQFNSLPPDHPDRVKYAVPYVLVSPGLVQGRDQPDQRYTMPPMQHQVMTYPSSPAEPMVYYPAQPGGQGQAYAAPQSAATYAVPPPHPISSSAWMGPAYSPSPQSSYVPENDPPPAYSDIVKDA